MMCPRCDSYNVRLMVKYPIKNSWEVYVCNKCFYSWRSTEKIEELIQELKDLLPVG